MPSSWYSKAIGIAWGASWNAESEGGGDFFSMVYLLGAEARCSSRIRRRSRLPRSLDIAVWGVSPRPTVNFFQYNMSTHSLAVAVSLVAGVLLATGVDAEEDEEEEGEAPER